MTGDRRSEASEGRGSRATGDGEAADATVSVTVPGLLARFTDGRRAITVRADTLHGCVAHLVESRPAIEAHLFDGSGDLRTHLQLFHNGESVEWGDATSVELADGDEVLVLQAVSGG